MFYKGIKKLPSIEYRSPLKAPVRIKIFGDDILITAHVRYDSFMKSNFKTRKSDDKVKEESFTYADMFEEGVRKAWEKDYLLEGFGQFHVKVRFIREGDPDLPEGQKTFKVKKARISNTSFVSSSFPRLFWGLFMYLSPESAMLNWSKYHPGTVNMKDYARAGSFRRVSAHEFGHILGIGDAYGAHYRFFYEAPDTETYMMNRNGSVAPTELMMVLRAHETCRMQYFPIKISPKRVLKGWKSMISGMFKDR